MQKLISFLESSLIKYRQDEPASKHTTIAAGGLLHLVIEPDSLQQLSQLIVYLHDHTSSYMVLGAGSNTIISDQGISKPVIRLGKGFRYYRKINPLNLQAGAYFEVGGAMPLMSLSRDLSAGGFSGLEFAGGIPATLGGAVRMNAGAHKEEMSGILEEVNYINSAGEIHQLKKEHFNFTYRNSGLPADALVFSAVIRLESGDPLVISEKRRIFLDYRKNTQPLTQPSFGSVFKNPAPDKAAGMLIEQCGLKGYKSGGASVSEMHANWIVNIDRRATADEVTELISHIQRVVFEKTGYRLEKEVVYFSQ